MYSEIYNVHHRSLKKCYNYNNINVFLESQFPIQVQRYQSMQSLRHLRDPHYQGIRSRKARRVIDKSGDRNVTNTNIPERSWRFLKDFVNTLVRLLILYNIEKEFTKNLSHSCYINNIKRLMNNGVT